MSEVQIKVIEMLMDIYSMSDGDIKKIKDDKDCKLVIYTSRIYNSRLINLYISYKRVCLGERQHFFEGKTRKIPIKFLETRKIPTKFLKLENYPSAPQHTLCVAHRTLYP